MKQKDMYTYRCMSKLFSLFCLETNKMNIKRNITCEEPCSSTLQRFPIICTFKRFFLQSKCKMQTADCGLQTADQG